ncbi:hypothetical protein WDZ17_09805 [Pseudokineococcus basanitobsidens]|uniref:Shikimate kinase n=1 Tax=Pseudokineococcus basanitobsidens TaxID=1926649 RepID=A0ABU8RKM0_9ACTN
MVLWLTGAPGLVEEVADELWALLPGARVVDPGPLEPVVNGALGARGLAALEGSRGWGALVATTRAELAAWRSERVVVPRPVLDQDLWSLVETALLRAGLEAELVALDADDERQREKVRTARVAVGPRLREVDRHAAARPWLHRRADVVVDADGRSPHETAVAVAAALGRRAPPRSR